MKLSLLLDNIVEITPAQDCEISRIISDSRDVQSGDLFIALKGFQQDGRRFIPDAIAKGASAVLVENVIPAHAGNSLEIPACVGKTPLISITNLPQYLGEIAARFYHYPARNLKIFGVTGTNGKTSCTHFIAQCLTALKHSCGIIGTLGSGFYGTLKETGFTTPDALTLQAVLKSFIDHHAEAVAMEVSSHSIDQGRVNSIEFDVGVFTNLTQDHLDYHGDMQTYAAVKKRFIAEFPVRQVIINADDPYGQQWIKELARKPVISYSVLSTAAEVYAHHTQLTLQGITTEIVTPWGKAQVNLSLIGLFNLSNMLAVIAALCAYGIPFNDVIRVIQQVRPVPGRMQLLGGQRQPLVVVDYAHTPDALQNALQALRSHTQGKLVCVFGCGGDRDKGKRPLMAKIAEQIADKVIVTSDNPRHEDPAVIAAEIRAGFLRPESVFIELDRSKAIQNSIQWSESADCILIAGKGAEHYQQIGDQKLPFDDVTEATRFLEKN